MASQPTTHRHQNIQSVFSAASRYLAINSRSTTLFWTGKILIATTVRAVWTPLPSSRVAGQIACQGRPVHLSHQGPFQDRVHLQHHRVHLVEGGEIQVEGGASQNHLQHHRVHLVEGGEIQVE